MNASTRHATRQEAYWIPQRLVQGKPRHFMRWTFRQRKVFALVDGKRTISQIARLLSTSPTTVVETLYELQFMRKVAQEQILYV